MSDARWESGERFELESAEALRSWLMQHHDSSTGVWVVRWKKGHGPYVPYPEMVRELLCFGWIDGQARKVDDDRSAVLACPRRRGGGWSRVNKEHIEVLRSSGRMQPAGEAAIARAVEDGSWTSLDEVETLREPDDLRAALDSAPTAREHWDAFPRSTHRMILYWISSARTQLTRDKRIAVTVEEAAAGRRANQPQPRR